MCDFTVGSLGESPHINIQITKLYTHIMIYFNIPVRLMATLVCPDFINQRHEATSTVNCTGNKRMKNWTLIILSIYWYFMKNIAIYCMETVFQLGFPMHR